MNKRFIFIRTNKENQTINSYNEVLLENTEWVYFEKRSIIFDQAGKIVRNFVLPKAIDCGIHYVNTMHHAKIVLKKHVVVGYKYHILEVQPQLIYTW